MYMHIQNHQPTYHSMICSSVYLQLVPEVKIEEGSFRDPRGPLSQISNPGHLIGCWAHVEI